ncbi:kinase-like protein [Sporormia fimetaria CBS 119925]|uniref:Kinase-like protein n=1 Tax=Sporormia fimetaria CBS 119925 TaxID=1340428 RepID=A0A6A6UYH9_9PLEO|nr:kinase-like protein [Sporormia fimetaria CBS 119925]
MVAPQTNIGPRIQPNSLPTPPMNSYSTPKMSPTPIRWVYPFEIGPAKYTPAMNIEFEGQEYRIRYSGDWQNIPDLSRIPQVDSHVTVTHIPHSQEIDEIWAKSTAVEWGGGADSYIRILKNKGDQFPILKLGLDDRQRRLIQDEFSILRYLASQGCPVVRVRPEPLVDDKGIFGYMMEELCSIDVGSGHMYIRRITRALKDIHRQGVIHNDLHPGNVMVNKEGCVTLIDFGRAGYLGDKIPTDKRAQFLPHRRKLYPGFNSHRYSVELDMIWLKYSVDMYALKRKRLSISDYVRLKCRQSMRMLALSS